MTTLFQKSSACISDCGKYRYVLSRRWSEIKHPVVFVMLNPSTADADVDDPTIRRCMGFARDWGFGGITVVNLFAFRTPYPKELDSTADPIGPQNDSFIKAACGDRLVVAAWGAWRAKERIDAVTEIIKPIASELCCLGFTKDLHPRHPLYVAKAQRRLAYPQVASALGLGREGAC